MKKLQKFLVVVALLFSGQSYSDVQINGFGSVKGSYVSSDHGGSPYPEYEEGKVSFKSESLFAIQARANLTEGLSATIQLYTEGRNDFDVEARWAYISYQLSDQHQLNLGKFANPIFHQSEYEKVGFTHNYTHLPKSVYNDFDFATMEGISINSQFELYEGDYTLDTKVAYGSWRGEVVAGSENVPLGFDNIFSLNATLNGDWWKIFAGGFLVEMNADDFDEMNIYQNAQQSIDFALANGASMDDIQDFKNAAKWHEKNASYAFVGFGIDYNDWLFDFEFVNYGVDDSAGAENKNWYAAIAKRIDKFIITFHTEEFKTSVDYGFAKGISNPILNSTAKAIHNSLASEKRTANSISLRYDFHPSAAFKVSYLVGDLDTSSVGNFSIVSAGIDLVF